jgi:hypothetical protein
MAVYPATYGYDGIQVVKPGFIIFAIGSSSRDFLGY